MGVWQTVPQKDGSSCQVHMPKPAMATITAMTPHTMPTRFFALLFLGAAVSAGESFRISVFSLMMLSYSTR